jgi:uncharacterized membrane protein
MTDDTHRSFWGQFRTTFLRGVGFIIPLGLTFWFFKALLNAVDGILSPILEQWLGRHLPGLGFVSMLVVIFIVGILSRNLVGRLFFAWFESLLRSIPLVRSVYTAIKDLVGAFIQEDKSKTFRQVVMVEYPRVGLFCLGFVTNEMPFDTYDGDTMEFVNVYIPNPPNPTSGFLVLVPRQQAVPLDLTVEQGLKLVLSGGIVLPHRLRARRAYY